ncbi:MAG: [NiFe]-hydrogenase assembly chaperone HybE [Myxococcota bacterium]
MSGARECSVCWYVYRPEDGDEVWQVPPGTPFESLPEEWRCPRCDADPSRFLPPVSEAPSAAQGRAKEKGSVEALVDDYEAIAATTMKGLPLNNPRLKVEAVGFGPLGDGHLGVLITPWCINAVFLPPPGAKPPDAKGHVRMLPAGPVTFLPQRLPTAGDVEVASLFSPALEFDSQAAAVATAREALVLLRTPPAPTPPEARSRRELFEVLRGRPIPRP